MEIKTPKRIADPILAVQQNGFTDILLSDNFAYCFEPYEFKKLVEFIRKYDSVAHNLGKDNLLFQRFFYVAYDYAEKNSTWTVCDEAAFNKFISAYKCPAYIIPANGVLEHWQNDYPWAEECLLINYKDN